ncbi:MAG TPA: twin-arginine translocation pathway signal [Pseudolabrys sp.]|nr:twin-arginine translocation pathway signal [Pseudolabrys sp.]
MTMADRAIFRNPLASLVAVMLCGCAASDDTAARFLVAPDQFVLYNCPQLAEAGKSNATRQRELETLMAKADTDSTGRFVSGLSYRPEYLQLRGQMTELRKEAANKHCRFTPGVDMPTDRKSDAAVR